MQVYLTTLGCRLNEAEIERWSREFRADGHDVVGAPDQAQLMVVNTCAVTTMAARKSRKFVGGLHRQNPNARLVMTGCYAELEPEKAASLAGVDMIVGNQDKDQLVDVVKNTIDLNTMPELATEPGGSHMYPERERTRAFIKVQDGCRNRCTFCIVTIARGDERSRSVDDIVAEINQLHADGFQEAVLTGVHLGGYGHDLATGEDLFSLTRAVLERTQIPRVRLSSLEPWDLPDHFWELWSSPRLMPHLHLPLQSGSDAVLKRMARRCDTDSFASLVSNARKAIPDLSVTTDLIVGFPGETEDEWKQTVEYSQKMDFAHMHIFTYSAREGTKAATLRGQLRGDVKRERSTELHAIAARMKEQQLAKHVGRTRSVLWEGRGTPAVGGRCWSGYTDNYLRVVTVTPQSVDLQNRVTSTELISLVGDPPDRLSGRVSQP